MGGCQSTHMSAQTTPKNTPTWGDDDDGVTQRTTMADPSAVVLVGPSTSSPSGSSHAATSAPEQQQQQQHGLTNSRSSAASENNVTTTTPTPTPPLRGPPPLLTAVVKTSPQHALVGINSQQGQTAGGGGGNESCSMSSFSVPDETTCFNPTAQQRSKENSNSNPNIIIRSPLLQSPQEQQQSLPAPAQPLSSPSPFGDIHHNSNNNINSGGETAKPLFSFISPLDHHHAEKPRGRKVSATTLLQLPVDNATTPPSGAGVGTEKVQQQHEDSQAGKHLSQITHLRVGPPQPNGDDSVDQRPTASFDVGVSNVSVGVESGSTDSCDGAASDSNVATASVAGDVEVREVKEEDNTDGGGVTEGVAPPPPLVDEDKKLLFPSLSSSETSTASASCDVIIVSTNNTSNATGAMMEFVSPQHTKPKPPPPPPLPPQQPPALSSAFALPVPRHAIQTKHPALTDASSSPSAHPLLHRGGGGGADDDGDALGNDTAPLPFVTGGFRVAAARHR